MYSHDVSIEANAPTALHTYNTTISGKVAVLISVASNNHAKNKVNE